MAAGDPATRVTENTILLRIIMTPVSRTRSFVFKKTTSKFRAWRSMHVCFRKHFAQRRLLFIVRNLL